MGGHVLVSFLEHIVFFQNRFGNEVTYVRFAHIFSLLVSKVQQRGDKPRGSIDSFKDWVGLHSSCIMVPVWSF